MTSYLLSFLRKKYASRTLEDFLHEMPPHWLVWEPGHWRPAWQVGETMLAPEAELASRAGEALAMALTAPRSGQAHLVLGRDDENDLVVQDATVSRVHLFLTPRPGGWAVRDGGSSNGSWVDDWRLDPGDSIELANGVKLRAGAVQLTFYEAAGLFARVQQKG